MKPKIAGLDQLDEKVRENVMRALKEGYDEHYKREIISLLKSNPQKLSDAFFQTLSFGTGGIRALMGVGTNRLNEYTIEFATQGLANYIATQPKKRTHHRVFISYDNRKNSFLFAKIAARVLAANDIEAYIVKNLRPTPICSFGCIHYHCIAGIMITASHNPPDYNGYKVYWEDGAQVLPPHDKGIIHEVQKINQLSQVKLTGIKNPLIHWVSEELDHVYIEMMKTLQNYPENNRKKGHLLKIVYSNLHGTGITIVPQLLHSWGFRTLFLVKEQLATDPKFPGAKKPNPEEKDTLEMGVRTLCEKKADLFLATDPDSDRVGVVISQDHMPISFSGNQIACICLYHLFQAREMPKNAAFVKTIVTTELFRAMCDHYQASCFDVLTGFKYIAQKIREWEKTKEYQFIFGGEESLGYLLGTFVRDKDAATASGLIAEAALYAKGQGLTLYTLLKKIYAKFGVFREKLSSISFSEGKESMLKMKKIMDSLRNNPPKEIHSIPVSIREDYLSGTSYDVAANQETKLTLPSSNVLRFWLEDKSKIVIRPSGTEPKIKIYVGAQKKEFQSVDIAIKECDALLKELIQGLESHFERAGS